MIGALHSTVLGNIGTNYGFNAYFFKLAAELKGIDSATLGPTLNGYLAILNVNANGYSLAVLLHRVFQKILIGNCGGA